MAVHFIKKNMWYLETALALLDGDEYSEEEKYAWNRHLEKEEEARRQKDDGTIEVETSGGDSFEKVEGNAGKNTLQDVES